MVNAVAILQMGGTVAHHTGNASHAGRLAVDIIMTIVMIIIIIMIMIMMLIMIIHI